MKKLLLLIFFIGFILIVFGQELPDYLNTSLPVEIRVEDLLKRMTLEEKIDLLSGINEMETKANIRLGIPSLRMSDGGGNGIGITAFPRGVSFAASWDTSLVYKVAKAIAKENKALKINIILQPTVNIHRIPGGGRNFESFGEDPFLASRITVSYIKGIQSEGLYAMVKHFACNNQEHNRLHVNSVVDEQTLMEIYFPAFKAAVREAGCEAVMAAYNKLNGSHCAENNYLLNTVLRKEWGFKGIVVSDWNAVHSTINTLKYGVDLEMPEGTFFNHEAIKKALLAGEVDTQAIDLKVSRLLRVIFKLNLFEKKDSNRTELNSIENQKLALKMAESSIVLLKNEKNILPLKLDKIKSIAVIGPNAAISRTGGGGSSYVKPLYSISLLEGLKKQLSNQIKIEYTQGTLPDNGGTIISSSHLATGDNIPGLKGEYFSNMNFEGKPAIARTDPQIDFSWSDKPDISIPAEGFSVRWTGFIIPDQSCYYKFYLTSDDGTRLYINDELIISNWGIQGMRTKTGLISLEKGKRYRIRLDYFENTGYAGVKLAWQLLDNLDAIDKAVDLARRSDLVLLYMGFSDSLESEGWDIPDLMLPPGQNELISAIAAVNPNTIVILNSGIPVNMENWIKKVPAIIQAWYPGMEAGNALPNIILGKKSPSGKLPVTFPKKTADCPAMNDYPEKNGNAYYKEGIFVGYRYFDKFNKSPQFPFGFGLSYTSFKYSDITIDKSVVFHTDTIQVTFILENTGEYFGEEIAQLYISCEEKGLNRPVKELKGFKKVAVKPGEKKMVIIPLKISDLAYYDSKIKGWKIIQGKYTIQIGSSSQDIRLKSKIYVK